MFERIKKALGIDYKDLLKPTPATPISNPVEEIVMPVEAKKEVIIPDPLPSTISYLLSSTIFDNPILSDGQYKTCTISDEGLYKIKNGLSEDNKDLFNNHLKTTVSIHNNSFYKSTSIVMEIYLNSSISNLYDLSSTKNVTYTERNGNYKLSLYVNDIDITYLQTMPNSYLADVFIPYCFNYILSSVINSDLTYKNKLTLDKFKNEFENIQDYLYDLEIMSSENPVIKLSNNQMVFVYCINNLNINEVSVSKGDIGMGDRHAFGHRGVYQKYCDSITYTPEILQVIQIISTTSKRIKDKLPDCDINFKLMSDSLTIIINQPLIDINSINDPYTILYRDNGRFNGYNVAIGRHAMADNGWMDVVGGRVYDDYTQQIIGGNGRRYW